MDPTLTPVDQEAISSLSTAALQRGADLQRAVGAELAPGFFSTLEVVDGATHQMLRSADLAARETALRETLHVQALHSAPMEPYFLPRPQVAAASNAQLASAPEQQMALILDGALVYDPTFDGPLWERPGPGIPPDGPARPPRPWDPPDPPGSPEPGDPPYARYDGTQRPVKPCHLEGDLAFGVGGCTTPPPGPPEKGHYLFDPKDNPRDWNALSYAPSGASRCPMVLLLHGQNGLPEKVEPIAGSYARAGFRTLSLGWGATCTARRMCAGDPGALASDLAWDTCLAGVRLDNMMRIIDRTTQALIELDSQRPTEGWGEYLTTMSDGTRVPRWSKMIFAGYSEGANQSAWNTRWLRPHSAIFYSGGGDAERPAVSPSPGVGCPTLDEDCSNSALAGWMYMPPLGDEFVAYQNKYEPCDLSDGWTLDHVGIGRITYDSNAVTDLADFANRPRLLREDVSGYQDIDLDTMSDAQLAQLQEAAHRSAKDVSYGMLLTHTYLVCRAAGLL